MCGPHFQICKCGESGRFLVPAWAIFAGFPVCQWRLQLALPLDKSDAGASAAWVNLWGKGTGFPPTGKSRYAKPMLPLRISAILLAASWLGACAANEAASSPVARPDAPAASQWAQACTDFDDWDKAGPPFRIHGNSYYVCTCGIAAILITGEAGHVLIDGATEKGAQVIAANIERLGLRPGDVKLLLHSHEHFDHVGGTARLQALTGARMLASAAAAPVLTSGEAASDDPQHGTLKPFAPVRVDGRVTPGEPVRLGEIALTPLATPGHTSGALSWRWQACAGSDCRTIVFADSLSAVSSDSYRFSAYPAYLAAYRASLDRLGALECDILLTPHPSSSQMRKRLLAGSLSGDGSACRAYADTLAARLDERLAREAQAPR